MLTEAGSRASAGIASTPCSCCCNDLSLSPPSAEITIAEGACTLLLPLLFNPCSRRARAEPMPPVAPKTRVTAAVRRKHRINQTPPCQLHSGWYRQTEAETNKIQLRRYIFTARPDHVWSPCARHTQSRHCCSCQLLLCAALHHWCL